MAKKYYDSVNVAGKKTKHFQVVMDKSATGYYVNQNIYSTAPIGKWSKRVDRIDRDNTKFYGKESSAKKNYDKKVVETKELRDKYKSPKYHFKTHEDYQKFAESNK